MNILGFLSQFRSPIYILKIISVITFIFILIILIDVSLFYFKINDFINFKKRYTNHQLLFNESDTLKELMTFSSDIYNYEALENEKFLAIEIWDKNSDQINSYPLWNINNIQFYKEKKHIQDTVQNAKSYIFFINKYLFFGYNSKNIFMPKFPISKSKNSSELENMSVIFYMKVFDFGIFKNKNFFISSLIISLILFLFITIFICIPIYIFKIKSIKNIEKTIAKNIHGLFEHALVNQESVLKSLDAKNEKVQRTLFYNHEAQKILKSISYQDIDIQNIIHDITSSIYIPSNVKICANINTKKNPMFSKNHLFICISTILNNALHPDIKAQNIEITVFQKRFSSKIFFAISNDGLSIPKSLRRKIFNGHSTKSDGHGMGLKNIKQIINKSGNTIYLKKNGPTCFIFSVPSGNIKTKTLQHFFIEHTREFKKSPESENHLNKTKVDENLSHKKTTSLVAIIEDDIHIWDSWKNKMTDAQILFFKTPDEFFFHCDLEKAHDAPFISHLNAIICDYDFGQNSNIVNSHFFETLAQEDEDFRGTFILCTGYNQDILKNIPTNIKQNIHKFYQKRPAALSTVLKESISVNNHSK